MKVLDSLKLIGQARWTQFLEENLDQTTKDALYDAAKQKALNEISEKRAELDAQEAVLTGVAVKETPVEVSPAEV